MRLRSSKVIFSEESSREDFTINQEQSLTDETESHKTPPGQNIESCFPESPFGRKRVQSSTDRHTTQDIKWNQEFNFQECHKEEQPMESKKMAAFFRSEILGDTEAAREYILNTASVQRKHRPACPTSTGFFSHSTVSETDNVNIFESPRSLKFQISPFSEAGRRILLTKEYRRQLSPSPIKVLDAPNLLDNFYLNLLDWGKDDVLAVGLGHEVYLWNANTSQVILLCQLPEPITSVRWSRGPYLAVGTYHGRIILYDTIALAKVRTWTDHILRVSGLAWASNVLSSGGQDRVIYHHDVRSFESHFRTLKRHSHEVCGLSWNPQENSLASGGNDNQVIVWDGYQGNVLYQFREHTAAVKALCWSPHKRGILVSGGGTTDQTLKQWNTISGLLVSSFDTGSQICNLAWSKKTDEIISSHGYARPQTGEANRVHIWKANDFKKKGSLSGHRSRVLYMSMSPDENTIVTGAPDENLMFWDVYSTDEVIKQDPRGGILR